MSVAPYPPAQLAALRRFAAAITALTVLGHAVLGFEQSYAQPLVAVATAYALQVLLEWVDARCDGRRPRFAGGLRPLADFLLSAHITALAVAMLLYFNDRLWVVAFATAVAIGSKTIFRVPLGPRKRHVFNPSNFGITATLLLFPGSVGLVPPWHFTEELPGALDWGLLAFIFALGSYINGSFTGRLPLIAAWLAGFVAQAALRSVLFGNSLPASLAPVTGIAFALFTFYMIPDPATTPERPWRQVAFGAAVAAAYGLLMALHVVFALFLALTVVCALRGTGLYALAVAANRRTDRPVAAAPLRVP
jgi:enediyne biosynthesis protein E5